MANILYIFNKHCYANCESVLVNAVMTRVLHRQQHRAIVEYDSNVYCLRHTFLHCIRHRIVLTTYFPFELTAVKDVQLVSLSDIIMCQHCLESQQCTMPVLLF